MNKNSKSQLLKANAIGWGAAVLAALILTYAPHGPAKQPGVILLICLLPVMMMSLRAVGTLASSQLVLATQGVLWLASVGIGFYLGTTKGIHPVATTVTLAVGGAIAIGILCRAKTKEVPEVTP